MGRILCTAAVAVLMAGVWAPRAYAQSRRPVGGPGAVSAMSQLAGPHAGAGAAAMVAPAGSAADQLQALAKKTETSNHLLFGTEETQSENFQPFEKWTSAVDKMAKERANLEQFKTQFKKWLDFLDTLKDKDQETQISEVNKLMNQSDYVTDPVNWGVSDYWESPGEFLAKFGDCEDYAIAKYMALKYLGFPADKMRIVAVKDLNLKVGHAILAVYFPDNIMILDNQIKIVVDSRKIRHYEPVYSINEKAWWRHRASGSAPTG
jgi:predicted transglutaminase-like cysteine proteinase